jgi:hypothetical protein
MDLQQLKTRAEEPVQQLDSEQASGKSRIHFTPITARLEAMPHKDLAVATQSF